MKIKGRLARYPLSDKFYYMYMFDVLLLLFFVLYLSQFHEYIIVNYIVVIYYTILYIV